MLINVLPRSASTNFWISVSACAQISRARGKNRVEYVTDDCGEFNNICRLNKNYGDSAAGVIAGFVNDRACVYKHTLFPLENTLEGIRKSKLNFVTLVRRPVEIVDSSVRQNEKIKEWDTEAIIKEGKAWNKFWIQNDFNGRNMVLYYDVYSMFWETCVEAVVRHMGLEIKKPAINHHTRNYTGVGYGRVAAKYKSLIEGYI